MKKRVLSIISIAALTLSLTMPVSAATTKTGDTVTGKEVLEFVNDNIKDNEEPEYAVIIQTRQFASIKKHGFTVANFGAVLSTDGQPEGKLPKPTTKKNWSKDGWRYITQTSPIIYLNKITNTNAEVGIFQKKDELDAHDKGNVFYATLAEDAKSQEAAKNTLCLYDKDNALYVKEDATFFKYEIKDPESDEVIGYMFIEKNPKASSKPPKKEEVVSILGDSISSYDGFIPSGYTPFYPEKDITDPNKTWWEIMLTSTGYALGTNGSSGGCACVGDSTSEYITVASTNKRINALGDNKEPTKIIVYLGTNDLLGSYPIGSNDGNTNVAEGNVDNFSDAYTLILNKLKDRYPDAKIYCCTLATIYTYDSGSFAPAVNGNGDTVDSFNSVIKTIAGNKGATVIDLQSCGIDGSNVSTMLQDGVHPTVDGMKLIANAVISAVK